MQKFQRWLFFLYFQQTRKANKAIKSNEPFFDFAAVNILNVILLLSFGVLAPSILSITNRKKHETTRAQLIPLDSALICILMYLFGLINRTPATRSNSEMCKGTCAC